MLDMLRVMKESEGLSDCPVVLFSTGKDSIVTLDIVSQFYKDFKIVHMYFVKGLSYREKTLKYYSQRYGKEIIQIPEPETVNALQRGVFSLSQTVKKESFVRMSDIERQIRFITGQFYLFTGEKKADSLNRRIMINHEGDGIDRVHGKVYPLADWTEKNVFKYLKVKKLPLPVEYQSGFRNIDSPNKSALLWMKNNFPEDYEKVLETFPLIETLLHERETDEN
jgi:3'-phosphoadenosine 5'-phosphosulfate sulfotransferase (PAPS reductase)/FAD synthetase